MDKQQVQAEVTRIEEELATLQDKFDELDHSLKKSSVFSTVEKDHELEVVKRELEQKKMILKEYKERLRSL